MESNDCIVISFSSVVLHHLPGLKCTAHFGVTRSFACSTALALILFFANASAPVGFTPAVRVAVVVFWLVFVPVTLVV
ncbi:hypothetical protein C8J57DRAFT_1384357 [Mycena rebaudengoi]|nr:hypothetical protein C8J57DRAFT_1384357 [Mycena rebaudengoi]